MSAYFIGNLTIEDEEMMKKYSEAIGDMVIRWGGEYLAVDDNPTIVEGKWEYSKVVLIRFPDEETMKNWYFSEEYKYALSLRLKAAKCDTIMIKGK